MADFSGTPIKVATFEIVDTDFTSGGTLLFANAPGDIQYAILPKDTAQPTVRDGVASVQLVINATTFPAVDFGQFDLWVQFDSTPTSLTFSATTGKLNSFTNLYVSTFISLASITSRYNTLLTSIDLSSLTALTTIVVNTNTGLATLLLPEFANAVESILLQSNSLTATIQNTIILAVWNNAIRKQQLSKTFNILGNDGAYSTQSAAYLTALNDNATFKWTINGVAPVGSGFTNIETVEDLQTLAVNKTVAAVQTKDFDASVTHTWGINKSTYQLITFATNTDITTPNTGTLAARIAAITNGNITFGATTYQVCGVYFDNSQTLKGFYVNSTTALTGDIAQSTTFASATYTCTPVNHYYRDIAVPAVYTSEKAKFGIINTTDYNLTVPENERVVGYNDAMTRIYYMGQTKQSTDTQAKTGFVPIGTVDAPFTGSYNCQGYKITNLYINTNAQLTSLFGAMTGALISPKTNSIGLSNGIFVGFGCIDTASMRTGIIGDISTYSNLEKSYSNNTFHATGNVNVYSGQLCGVVGANASVRNNYVTGKICIYQKGTFTPGGLVGYESAGSVTNSYSYGDVYNKGIKLTSATTQKLQAVGYAESGVINFNVYQLDGITYDIGSTYVCRGLTAAQFKDKSNFAKIPANYTGLAGITTHVTTNQYLQKTFVYNSTRTKLYICNTLINAAALSGAGGSILLTDTSYWTEMVLNTEVTVATVVYLLDDEGLFANDGENWISLCVHSAAAAQFRAYSNTGRVITADGKCYVALQNVPLTTAITNTAYWLEDTGFDWTIWRMGNLYPELMTFYIATYNFFKQNFGSSNFIFKQRG